MVYNTDPLKVDSNGDGLTDYEKVKNYHLDPNLWDNDEDGLTDYDELKVHNTDPKNPDTDAEGLNDGDEVNIHNTNPTKPDTDGDSLNDYAEIFTHKTDPLKSDTDNDMLSDGKELNLYQTNPLLKDTDGGTINDGIEVKRGTNPLNPNDDVAVIEFENVLFAFDSYKLDKNAVNLLKKVLNFMLNNRDVDLNIDGHTDSIGTRVYNQGLSERRANAAKNWLVRNGVPADRIFTKGFGEDRPVADNGTKAGRRLNRRAELKVGDAR
jgi:outer membrane protein OmpA-like peptidoglycan-associated protein